VEQPRGYYVFVPDAIDRERITVVGLLRAVRAASWKVVAITLGCALLALAVSFTQTRMYRSMVVMAPPNDGMGGRAGGGLPGNLSGLASLAGINLTAVDTRSVDALTILQSQTFLRDFITEQKLLPVLFAGRWDSEGAQWKQSFFSEPPTVEDGYELMKRRVLDVTKDPVTNVVTLRITWPDREIAARWANDLVDRLNERSRLMALDESNRSLKFLNDELQRTTVEEVRNVIYSLVEMQVNKAMLANVQRDYAFRVLDRAQVSDESHYVRPVRLLFLVAGLLIGILISTFYALWKQAGRHDVT
jgi:uncharacterized protein involved in exopolysaccharide biosynthesis